MPEGFGKIRTGWLQQENSMKCLMRAWYFTWYSPRNCVPWGFWAVLGFFFVYVYSSSYVSAHNVLTTG